MPHRWGVRSVMATPLRAGNHIVGSLKVTSDQPDAFSRSDVTGWKSSPNHSAPRCNCGM
jgi:putative methionine-R-sulfoxide reductase with GAF domain